MTRYTTLFALAAVALAACQDNSPTAPSAGAAPLMARGGVGNGNGNDDAPDPGNTSTRGVIPTAVSGNTQADGTADCAQYGGAYAVARKIDGASSARVADYSFTVSNDGTTLSFKPATVGTLTSVITAVLVKGGPVYDVYQYGGTKGPYPTDGNLTSPDNRGGNTPTISHYVVCYARISIDKKFTLAYKGSSTSMEAINPKNPDEWMVGPAGTPCSAANTGGRGCLDVPLKATRWLEYEITYTSPFAGTIVDNLDASKTALNTFHTKDNPYAGWPLPYYIPATFEVTSSGLFTETRPGQYRNPFAIVAGGNQTAKIIIDIDNPGHCGDRPYTNAVTLTVGQVTVTDSETIWIWPHGTKENGCDPKEGMH